MAVSGVVYLCSVKAALGVCEKWRSVAGNTYKRSRGALNQPACGGSNVKRHRQRISSGVMARHAISICVANNGLACGVCARQWRAISMANVCMWHVNHRSLWRRLPPLRGVMTSGRNASIWLNGDNGDQA